MLQPSNHTTHGPLKGDTEYYHLKLEGQTLENAAFSYVETLDIRKELKDRIAFDQQQVHVVEYVANG